jgi:hypothetical protein
MEPVRRLREQYPDVEILAFGPHVDGEAFKKAKAAGATGQVARGRPRGCRSRIALNSP